MNLPPFLLAAAILFWGWQSEQLWLALPVAAAFEAAHLPLLRRLRCAVSFMTLSRISNLCALLFVAMAIYFAFTEDATRGVLTTIKWNPLIILPLFLAIAYSGQPTVALSIISSSMRNRAKLNPASSPQADLGYPYLGLWLLAAGTSNQPGPGFYLGLLPICGWVLWRIRPPGRPAWLWGGLLLTAAIGGALVNQGLYHLQGTIEQAAMNWLAGDGDDDPARTETSLGHIGQLKLSAAVALQVTTGKVLTQPLLLKTASYNIYLAPSWLVGGGTVFQKIPPQPHHANAWRLTHTTMGDDEGGNDNSAMHSAQLDIAAVATRQNPLLALPPGATLLQAPQIAGLDRNRMGTILAELPGGHYQYRISYASAAIDHSPATPQDLTLPHQELALLQALAQSLHLPGQPAQRVLPIIKAYFANHFTYSTYRGGAAPGSSALADFLTRDRRGHCEHFATASVLLLRTAGIPARYAVGYSVQEPSRFGSGYVVRQRHAHAWAQAYVDGAWQDFDTTPASWGRLERDTASMWEPLTDAWAWASFRVHGWQVGRNAMLLGGLAVLLPILLLRWLRPTLMGQTATLRRLLQKIKNTRIASRPGAAQPDSAFYRIEQLLAQRGHPRAANEPLTHWLARITPHLGVDASTALAEVIHWHYRWRFGPLPDDARQDLQNACQDWLTRFGQD
jgi:hypothetical protein